MSPTSSQQWARRIRYSDQHLRVSDAERNAVVERLSAHFIELGLVEPAVAVVRREPLGDGVALGIGDPQVLVGVADAARPLLAGCR